MSLKFPHEITPVTEEEDKIIKKYYKDYTRPFVRVGPSLCLTTAGYAEHAADIYNLQPRPDDVWVTSYSRSGTTWLQELVWLLQNNLDYEALKASGVSQRYAFLEYPTKAAEVKKPPHPSGARATLDDFRSFPSMTSPRFVKSHLPLSLLPPALLDTSKVFYIARDVRDVVVSYHFMHKMFRYFDDAVTLREFWDLFRNDLIMHTPIFPHIKEAWNRRSHPNIFFVFFEDMKRDLPGSIDRVCSFLGKQYSAAEKQRLAQHLSFDNMKNNSPVFQNKENEEKSFFRKGKAGGWVQYFDEEMSKQANDYIAKNLADTDLRFPAAQ